MSEDITEEDGLIAFGAALRQRRKERGLSLRRLAEAVGLSASYLSAIECGRNPTTGRPPQPSATAVDRLCETLGLDRTAIFAPAPACAGCEHVLLYRLDARRDGLEALARQLGGNRAASWLCIVDPNTRPEPGARFHAWTWPFRAEPYPDDYLEGPRIVAALAGQAARHKAEIDGSYGVIIADCSSVMRWVANPDAEVEFEDEWCALSGTALAGVLGQPPALNICVYHQRDFEGMAQRVDRLALLLRLFETHERIAAVLADGSVVEGPQAMREILRENRPDSVSGVAWRMIAAAIAGQRQARPARTHGETCPHTG